MRGTYVFKQHGEIVAQATNLITTPGRREILRYLAGQRGTLGGAIGVGVGTTAPTLTDSQLVLEFERTMVEVGVPDFEKGLVIYKGTLPTNVEGVIYEVGLWSNATTLTPTSNVLAFDSGFETWTGGTWSSTNMRLGGEGLRVAATTNTTATATLSAFTGSLTAVAPNDLMTFSFFANDPNVASVRLRFLGGDNASYYEQTFNTVQRGYNIFGFLKASLTRVGTLVEEDITRVQLLVTSKTTDTVLVEETLDYTGTRVDFDRLIARPANSDDFNNVLVSRAVPLAPVVKRPVAPMEIEYYLELQV